MANLRETAEWIDGIYQIEKTDPVVGGEGGISNRQAEQLAARTQYLKKEVEKRAVKNSPAFTGTPTAPTAEQEANNDQIATTKFVKAAIAKLVGSAPAELDTLEELAALLAENGDLRRTLLQKIGEKANKATTLEGYGITDAINVTKSDYLGDLNNLDGKNTIVRINCNLHNNANFPEGAYQWGSLQTIHTGGYTHQFYFAENESGEIYTRTKHRTWRPWKRIANEENTMLNMTKHVSDHNIVDKTGLYPCNNETLNRPSHPELNGVDSQLLNLKSVHQHTQVLFNGHIIHTRIKDDMSNNGTWSEWMRIPTVEHDFAQSLTDNGWQKLPNGLILQWGKMTDGQVVNFPVSFPTKCLGVYLTQITQTYKYDCSLYYYNERQFRAYVQNNDGRFLAIGF